VPDILSTVGAVRPDQSDPHSTDPSGLQRPRGSGRCHGAHSVCLLCVHWAPEPATTGPWCEPARPVAVLRLAAPGRPWFRHQL